MATATARRHEKRSANKWSAVAEELGSGLSAVGGLEKGTHLMTEFLANGAAPVSSPQWAEALKVHLIPTDVLPLGPQRDTLAVLAAFGEVEIYQAAGPSGIWNLWMERPRHERVSVQDWVARTAKQYR